MSTLFLQNSKKYFLTFFRTLLYLFFLSSCCVLYHNFLTFFRFFEKNFIFFSKSLFLLFLYQFRIFPLIGCFISEHVCIVAQFFLIFVILYKKIKYFYIIFFFVVFVPKLRNFFLKHYLIYIHVLFFFIT